MIESLYALYRLQALTFLCQMKMCLLQMKKNSICFKEIIKVENNRTKEISFTHSAYFVFDVGETLTV